MDNLLESEGQETSFAPGRDDSWCSLVTQSLRVEWVDRGSTGGNGNWVWRIIGGEGLKRSVYPGYRKGSNLEPSWEEEAWVL